MKKNVSIIVIVVCLLVTSFMAYLSVSGSSTSGLKGIDADAKTWVMCKNSACKASSEMGEREFTAALVVAAQNSDPGRRASAGLSCEKCGKSSMYRAVKCPQSACQSVFLRGSVPNDLNDRCPKCMVSQTEEIRKARQ